MTSVTMHPITVASSTHIGKGSKRVNEDSHLITADNCLIAVFDGMGGYGGGDVASSLVKDVVETFFAEKRPTVETINDWFKEASERSCAALANYLAELPERIEKLESERKSCDEEITRLQEELQKLVAHEDELKAANAEPAQIAEVAGKITAQAAEVWAKEADFVKLDDELAPLKKVDPRMGSTAVVGVRLGNQLFIGNCGDSRGYLVHRGELKQITVDHEFGPRGLLTCVISASQEVVPADFDVFTIDLTPGDVILLCSDGVFGSRRLNDEEIDIILNTGNSAQQMCDDLIEGVIVAGAPDNITALVLKVEFES